MEQFLTYLAGLVSVALLGVVKRFTTVGDTAIGGWVKKFQPLIALVLTWALPTLWNTLHLTTPVPDATVMAQAPLATLVAIVCAELLAKFSAPKTP